MRGKGGEANQPSYSSVERRRRRQRPLRKGPFTTKRRKCRAENIPVFVDKRTRSPYKKIPFHVSTGKKANKLPWNNIQASQLFADFAFGKLQAIPPFDVTITSWKMWHAFTSRSSSGKTTGGTRAKQLASAQSYKIEALLLLLLLRLLFSLLFMPK